MPIINILSYIKSFKIASHRKRLIVDSLGKRGTGSAVYAVGKNAEALAANKSIGIDAIIDGEVVCGSEEQWNGIPLINPSQAKKGSLTINCSTSIRPLDTLRWLEKMGFENVINYFELAHALDNKDLVPDFSKRQMIEIEGNFQAWQEIYDHLADDISKKTLIDTLKFRLSADPNVMFGYDVRTDQQYMEGFMDYKNEIFVDAGGFDGDTTENFAVRYPDYRKIIVFEPSKKNIEKLRRRTSRLHNIEIHETGLSDKKETLSFDHHRGSASSIVGSGPDIIKVDRLDALVREPVSFIKMDLEGWEIPAIKGSVRHIREEMPKLAIAAYHNPEDIRKIFKIIIEMNDEYSVYLRYYTQGWSETVIYFMKK